MKLFQFIQLSFHSRNRYHGSFLDNTIPLHGKKDFIRPIVYCFWTGNNKMSPERSKCLQTIRENVGIPVTLITPENLANYILPDHPLHPAFQHLSNVHKSDYLRCYFMHFYGGGYCDVKKQNHNWESSFRRFNASRKWIAGYREVGAHGVAQVEGILGDDLRKYWQFIIGKCSYICRPQTSFTAEWYQELLHRMDNYSEELEKHPGNIMGDNEGYPIPWTNILGDIFHPLCLKYREHLMFDEQIKPDFSGNYR